MSHAAFLERFKALTLTTYDEVKKEHGLALTPSTDHAAEQVVANTKPDLMNVENWDAASRINWLTHIYWALKDPHVFHLHPSVAKLLYLTKNDTATRPFPFPEFYLNTEFAWSPTTLIRGLGIRQYPQHDDDDSIVSYVVADLADPHDVHDGALLYATLQYPFQDDPTNNLDRYGLFFFLRPDPQGRHSVFGARHGLDLRRLRQFVNSFLDFLNHPDVTLVESTLSPAKQKHRARQGLPPRPPHYTITVTGDIKRYVSRLEALRHFDYDEAFWVRGHYRHLQSAHWTHKQGQRIWVPPYVKGVGEVVHKEYVLTTRGARSR